MTIPAPPGAITRPNSSSTSAVPSRSTARIVAAGAWTGETPAVWTTWVTVPSSAAFSARACTDSREETSTRWVLTRWPRSSSAAAGRGLVVLADVGEEDVLAGALAAGDGLADAAGAGD